MRILAGRLAVSVFGGVVLNTGNVKPLVRLLFSLSGFGLKQKSLNLKKIATYKVFKSKTGPGQNFLKKVIVDKDFSYQNLQARALTKHFQEINMLIVPSPTQGPSPKNYKM